MSSQVITRRVKIDGILYPYDDAEKDVAIQRELVDIWKGRPGVASECMNAQCILRNATLFPHPVLATSVIKSRVFIFDSDSHVVRYTLADKDQRLVADHDELAIGQPGTLILRAPRAHDRAGSIHSNKKGRSGKHVPGGADGHPLPKGERARLMAAVGVAAK